MIMDIDQSRSQIMNEIAEAIVLRDEDAGAPDILELSEGAPMDDVVECMTHIAHLSLREMGGVSLDDFLGDLTDNSVGLLRSSLGRDIWDNVRAVKRLMETTKLDDTRGMRDMVILSVVSAYQARISGL